MDNVTKLIERFGDAIDIVKQNNMEIEINSILDAGNLDNRAKFRFICRELYKGDRLNELSSLLENVTNEDLEQHLNFRFEIDEDEEEDEQITHSLSDAELGILKEEAEVIYDPSKLLTAGEKKNLPVSLRDKFDVYDINDEEIVVLSKFLKISMNQAKRIILNRLDDIDNIEEEKVKEIVDEFLWDGSLVSNGYYATVEDGSGKSSKISLMEYFKRDGYSTEESKIKTIQRMRDQILMKLDKKSRSTEYSLDEIDLENLKKNFGTDNVIRDEDMMEFDGVCIVPKRKVKYDYSVKLDTTLRIENHNKLTPTREFAPYETSRCESTLSMLKEEIAKRGLDSRLEMENKFYTFKYLESLLKTNEYNGVNLNSGWSNAILSVDYCEERLGAIHSNESESKIRDNLDEFSNNIRDINIAYYEFKRAESIYEEELKEIKSRSE